MSSFDPLSWLLVIPLAWAVLSVMVPGHWRGGLALPALALQLAMAFMLFVSVRHNGVQHYALGGWPAPLGISLRADGLATVFLMFGAVVSAVVGLYARRYLRGHGAAGSHFWPLFWFMGAALNGIWLSADLFNLYVGLELLSLAAVGMVTLAGTSEALRAAIRYLLAALLGSLAYLLGVALLYGAYGTLSLPDLAEVFKPGMTSGVALGLMVTGLLIKTALFPLHGWLPPAHGGALTPVSALLSALVIKGSFYVIVRVWVSLDITVVAAAQLLGALGALAVLWGGWLALRATRLKMVVAYSTVAQIGYLFLLFPLLTVSIPSAAALAWDGALFLALSHAFAKAAMFLAVGNLVRVIGGHQLTQLAGTSGAMPISLFSFGLAGISLMGLPPSGGFIAKWLLLHSALDSGQWWWAVVLLVGGLLTAAYVFRIFRCSFQDSAAPLAGERPDLLLDVLPLLLALCAILLGLFSLAPLEQLRIGAHWLEVAR